MAPTILHRETVYDGYMRLERLRLRLDSGHEVLREVETHGDAVAVLPYDAARRTALTVRLLRTPAFVRFGETALEEACAGMIDFEDGDDAALAARREGLEELGVRLGALEFAGRLWASPGVSAERVSLFLAPIDASHRIAEGGGAEGEHEGIEVLERPLAELAADADAGRLADLKLLALVQTLRLRRPDLFGS
jgi:nudix-type nucleoside diphosphatase (YffH/AdpP family)